MLCERCEERIGKAFCEKCGEEVYALGDYCYLCGGRLEEYDWDERILCSDETCTGTINEKGFCNVCGKPFRKE